jgi:hypothetical protein
LDKIEDAIIETGIFRESNGSREPDEITKSGTKEVIAKETEKKTKNTHHQNLLFFNS